MSDIYEIENDGSNYSSGGCIVELVVCKSKVSKLEKEIKKLQEENKNLESESKKKDLIIEDLTAFLRKYQNSEDAYTYREIQDEIYLDVSDYLNFISKKQAREALAKVEE